MCTGGYMVRQDIIPEMLNMFPCCAPVDGCFLEKFKAINNFTKDFRGMEMMISMAARESRSWIENVTAGMELGSDWWIQTLGQHGVLYMDKTNIASERQTQKSE